MKHWLLIGLVVFGAWNFWSSRSIERAPGVIAINVPEQSGPLSNPPRFRIKSYTLKALARFSLQARVLGTDRYHFDREADLAPVDLVLGWGPMSDSGVLSKISIDQGGRFYSWHVREFPIPRREIEINSANMHLIPATSAVEAQIKNARVGNIVRLRGYLVEVLGDDGWRWMSSLTRADTGPGACEVIWVEQIQLL